MNDKKLAHVTLSVRPSEAMLVIAAFMRPFPSLNGISATDVLRVVSTSWREHHEVLETPKDLRLEANLHQKQLDALNRIRGAIEEASYQQWYGKAEIEDLSDWCAHWKLTLSPYVGDRILKISGGQVGQGHGENSLRTIEIDCLRRPSSNAMRHVIAWLEENPHAINTIAWGDRGAGWDREPWEKFPEWEEILK